MRLRLGEEREPREPLVRVRDDRLEEDGRVPEHAADGVRIEALGVVDERERERVALRARREGERSRDARVAQLAEEDRVEKGLARRDPARGARLRRRALVREARLERPELGEPREHRRLGGDLDAEGERLGAAPGDAEDHVALGRPAGEEDRPHAPEDRREGKAVPGREGGDPRGEPRGELRRLLRSLSGRRGAEGFPRERDGRRGREALEQVRQGPGLRGGGRAHPRGHQELIVELEPSAFNRSRRQARASGPRGQPACGRGAR